MSQPNAFFSSEGVRKGSLGDINPVDVTSKFIEFGRFRESQSNIVMSHEPENKPYNEILFIEKRRKFLDWLLKYYSGQPYCSICGTIADGSMVLFEKRGFKMFCNKCNQPLRYNKIHYQSLPVAIVEDGKFVLEKEYSGIMFNPRWNTRYISPTEIVIEFDCPFEQAYSILVNTITNLIKNKIHFSVWFAVGMRSHHIRIYDLLPLGLSHEEQFQARLLFCRKFIDWADLRYLDTTLLNTGQTIALEFSKHFKHDTMLKLIGEHLPEQKLTPLEIYAFSKLGEKWNYANR